MSENLYTRLYAAQRAKAAEENGIYPVGEQLPVTTTAYALQVWQWWTDEINRLCGLDDGTFGSDWLDAIGFGDDIAVPATINSPGKVSVVSSERAVVSRASGELLMDTHRRALIDIGTLDWNSQTFGVVSAGTFWASIASVCVACIVSEASPKDFGLWSGIVKGLSDLPAAAADAFGAGVEAIARAGGAGISGLFSGLVTGLFRSPVGLVALVGLAYVFRNEVKGFVRGLL